MQRKIRISLIATLAIAIGVMMVPGIGIVPAAYAGGHYHHHHHHGHHHHHHDHHSSVSVHQSVNQRNLCDHSSCSNSGSNSASISSGHNGSSHVRVDQSINQANACSNSHCTNTARNTANIH
jgi:hypothetical protein